MHRHLSAIPVAAALALALSLASPVARADVGFGGGVAAGKTKYTIESEIGQKWSGNANSVTLNGDVAFGNGFYVGLAHTQTSGDLEFTFQGQGDPSDPSDGLKRRDTALTFGWSAANRLNTFVGVKAAQSDIDSGIGTRFKTTGYFAGLSYPISFGSSTLALTGALGYNVGKWSDISGSGDAGTLGYSGGVRYVYAFSPRIAAGVGVKFQRYSYTFDDSAVPNVDETVQAVDLSLVFNF